MKEFPVGLRKTLVSGGVFVAGVVVAVALVFFVYLIFVFLMLSTSGGSF